MTDHPQRQAELLVGSQDWPQPRLVLGVTGSPGSGKSTLVASVVGEFRRRGPERRLGIVAVDPSSPFTGGALLGDRVRMMRYATDEGVFIRSLASRGRLGGLALGAKGVVRVMGLIGCDAVIVETVGVGQSEVEIARHADLTAVVLAPGQGDSIQLLKAGLIEAGDLFVVNKSDREEAARLHQQLLAALHMGPRSRINGHHGAGAPVVDDTQDRPEHGEADRPVFLCSAVQGTGVAQLVDHLDRAAERHGNAWQRNRRTQAVDEIREAVLQEVERRVDCLIGRNDETDGRLAALLSGAATVGQVADDLLHEAARRSESHDAIDALITLRRRFGSFQRASEGV